MPTPLEILDELVNDPEFDRIVQIDSDFVYSQVPTCALIGVTDLPFHNL